MGQSPVKSFCDRISKTETNILLKGYHGSGKTTTMFQLKFHEFIQAVPFIFLQVDTIDYNDSRYTVWDSGVRVMIRSLERNYHKKTDAIMVIIDSSRTRPERFKQIRDEMEGDLYKEELRNCAVAIVANKQDLPDALPKDEIARLLKVEEFRKSHTCEIFATTATTGDGLNDVMDWLHWNIKYNKNNRTNDGDTDNEHVSDGKNETTKKYYWDKNNDIFEKFNVGLILD